MASANLDMLQIKTLLSDSLKQLGYYVSHKNTTNLVFKFCGMIGDIWIRSANPKKFEVEVISRKSDDFLIPPFKNPSERYRPFYIIQRFHKREDSIKKVLIWLATSVRTFDHLRQLMNLKDTFPEHFGFTAETLRSEEDDGLIKYYHGLIESVLVQNIVSVAGHMISGMPYNPSQKPYFLIEISIGTGGLHTIVTDGDIWYPTARVKQDLRIFYSSTVDELRLMNQRDKELISAALQRYVDKIMAEDQSSS